jgi:hypothetical protein
MFKTTIFAAAMLLGAANAQAGVFTGFNAGSESWAGLTADLVTSGVPVQANPAVSWSGAGGNPDGAISVTDPDGWDTFFAAPVAFLGNQSTAFGTTLGYDLFTDQSADYNGPNVVLKGGGLTLVHAPASQAAVVNNWVSISVLLGNDGLWHLDSYGGALATAADLQTALGSLTALWISGETHNGVSETSTLDNVRLGRIGTPVPEPGSLPLVVSMVLAALALRRRG